MGLIIDIFYVIAFFVAAHSVGNFVTYKLEMKIDIDPSYKNNLDYILKFFMSTIIGLLLIVFIFILIGIMADVVG